MATDLDLLWAVFRRVDRSRDGIVSRKELAIAAQSGLLSMDETTFKAILSFADEDDNGNEELTFPAFFRALTNQQLDQRITPSMLKLFTHLDVNNDGFVDKQDLKKVIAVRSATRAWIRRARGTDAAAGGGLSGRACTVQSGSGLTRREAQALLEAADDDGDGRISLSEYASLFARDMSIRLSPADEKVLRDEFAKLDDNGDGYISRFELKKAAEKLGKSNAAVLATLERGDLDGDGVISFEEFVRMVLA